jgi:hypothetical protein
MWPGDLPGFSTLDFPEQVAMKNFTILRICPGRNKKNYIDNLHQGIDSMMNFWKERARLNLAPSQQITLQFPASVTIHHEPSMSFREIEEPPIPGPSNGGPQ